MFPRFFIFAISDSNGSFFMFKFILQSYYKKVEYGRMK